MAMNNLILLPNIKPFERDEFSLAVMHGTVGSSVGSEHHDVTGPCNLTDIMQGAMDYWALGHIHKSQVTSEDPMVVYAGNPQGITSQGIWR